MSYTKEYAAFSAAKQRCQNPSNERYADYGGRGIKFKFKSFEQFFAELGKCPRGKSLDRIDTHGHYESGNVRWGTKKQQYASRRHITNWLAKMLREMDDIAVTMGEEPVWYNHRGETR